MRNAFNWLTILLVSLLGLILAILTALILVGSVHLNRTSMKIIVSNMANMF